MVPAKDPTTEIVSVSPAQTGVEAKCRGGVGTQGGERFPIPQLHACSRYILLPVSRPTLETRMSPSSLAREFQAMSYRFGRQMTAESG